jgi:hypothetical protein
MRVYTRPFTAVANSLNNASATSFGAGGILSDDALSTFGADGGVGTVVVAAEALAERVAP